MRTTLEIKRIDLWSLFKVAFFIYALAGLVVGLFYGLFLLLGTVLQEAFLGEDFPSFGLAGGILGVVLIPLFAVFYGALGSVFITIAGFFYNLFAGSVGGLRFSAQVDVGPAVAVNSTEPGDDTPPTI